MEFSDKVFLASASPRRRELLRNNFNNIKYISSKLPEPSWEANQSPAEYLSHCLSTKWKGAELALRELPAQEYSGQVGLIVADTTVVLGRRLLEKPKDPADARRMLKQLSGRTHLVITGIIVGRLHEGSETAKREFSVTSEVTFYSLTDAEINAYVATGDPMDKAGAYGFQDKALKFVKSLKGSYLNVVGLPLEDLVKHAREIGLR